MLHFDSQQMFLSQSSWLNHENNASYAAKSNDLDVWDPIEARLGPKALPYFAALPLFTTGLILICLLLRWILPHPPIWATNFIAETKQLHGELDQPPKRGTSYWSVALFLVSAAGFGLQTASLSQHIHELTALFGAISWGLALILVALIRPRRTSWSLVGLYLSVLISRFIVLTNQRSSPKWQDTPDGIGLLAAVAANGIALLMPMRPPDLPKDGISPAFEKPTKELRTPEDDISLWQWMTVSWMAPLIAVGKKRQLNDDDVWFLGYEFQHARLHQAFRVLNGTVVNRLLQANGLDLFISCALASIRFIVATSSPLVLQLLLASMENPASPKRSAIMFAILMFVMSFVDTQCSMFGLWIGRRAYERSRGEMITMMYEKTLKRKMAVMPPKFEEEEVIEHDEDGVVNGENGVDGIKPARNTVGKFYQTLRRSFKMPFGKFGQSSARYTALHEAKQPASMGKILNMMKSDVYEVAQQFWDVDMYVMRFGQFFLCVVFIWKLLGLACLLGVLTVVIAQVITAAIARVLLRWEKLRRVATDVKLQVVSQFVEAIRHLRWYGWQDSWLEQIIDKRQQELNLRVVTSIWNMLIMLANGLASGMFPVVAFFAYTVILKQPLRVDIAFPALQLFRQLEFALRSIPLFITKLLNAYVALKRVEDFMTEPDKLEPEKQATSGRQPELKDATFTWPGGHKVVLRNVSLSFPVGLNVIGGKVAAGKTALLLALLGELDQLSGEYHRSNDTIGYCAQTPWLQSMSIRENILFHSPYDEARYKEILDACALTPDLANFKHRDLSMIGENGIGLSGGQRARVALARAIYSPARILMLDDPLSALDHQTAESIVRKCLTSSLVKGRTVILVTHRLEICQGVADQLIEIDNGNARVVDNAKDIADDTNVDDEKTGEEGTTETQAGQDTDEVVDQFMEEERREHGGIKYSVYWEYIKAGKVRWWLVLVVFLAIYRTIAVGQSWFLKEWGEAYNRVGERSTPISNFFDRLPAPEDNVRPWLIGFFIIAVAQTVANLIAQAFMLVIVYTAGKQMFKDVIKSVAHATFRFYDVTPTGRLMNRMTSDIGTIDGNISRQFQEIADLSVTWISCIVVIASVTPVFFIYSVAMTAAFVYIFLRFLPTSHSLRRLEMVSLSPLMSDFGALVDGLTTVRAFCAQSRFQDRVIAVTDAFQKMDHFYWSLQAWLNYRFDLLADISIFFLIMLALWTNVSPGLVAFALVSAQTFVQATHSLCKSYGQLQMDFVSVERIVELLRLDQEPPGDIDPPASWPTYSGDLSFSNVTIRYAPHLDPALNDLSFNIKGGSTTAIVGRTGSGKSTIALTLLATLVPEAGSIMIDGLKIAKVNKQALRSRVTFLAQDPVLFPGPLRKNLDPLNQHDDEACTHVLERVCPNYDWTLNTEIDAGGRNLSQGQRQLIGLARAILRQSSIVILDEATASVDLGTSREVQRVLREELKGATVVTIAHRVEAVRGAERYVVLGKGRVIEQGSVGEDGRLVAEE